MGSITPCGAALPSSLLRPLNVGAPPPSSVSTLSTTEASRGGPEPVWLGGSGAKRRGQEAGQEPAASPHQWGRGAGGPPMVSTSPVGSVSPPLQAELDHNPACLGFHGPWCFQWDEAQPFPPPVPSSLGHPAGTSRVPPAGFPLAKGWPLVGVVLSRSTYGAFPVWAAPEGAVTHPPWNHRVTDWFGLMGP